MQSQQKRVKWSRGETAEALEERTDTGVTQASLELVENCIPDIYGNISRRPALKAIRYAQDITSIGFYYDRYLQVFPFYITENDYILVGVHFTGNTELIRVQDGLAVYKTTVSGPKTGVEEGMISGVYTYRPVSYAQQNNYMLIADGYNVWKLQISNFDTIDGSFSASCDFWKFSAGWYAPNGTQTKQVNSSIITGLMFTGGFSDYVYTDINNNGDTTVYSLIDTSLTGNAGETAIRAEIPEGSIVQFPNLGTYMRVEGYTQEGNNTIFPGTVFDSVVILSSTDPDPAPGSGNVCAGRNHAGGGYAILQHYSNGTLIDSRIIANGTTITVKCSAYLSGYAKSTAHGIGYGINGFTSWEQASAPSTNVYMFGSLLTPVADDNATDSVVSVEYGFVSLQPASPWAWQANYPHPRKLLFMDQRLWGAGWSVSTKEQYAIVLGSQIAKYTDFKNDYNQDNEAITLDILTSFKEKILHLVDYNGLKIMTDSYEYAYDDKVVKQSGNGSLENCEPLVFESICLYADSTGNQIKAMQYEFQANIFNSSSINTLAPHDLIWYPLFMAAYEDKIHNTGKHLFIVNEDSPDNPRVAICNFVPNNQANIWSRWIFERTYISSDSVPFIHSIVRLKSEPLFLVTLNLNTKTNACIIPCKINFDSHADCESSIYSTGGINYFSPIHISNSNKAILANAEIAIYSEGVFQFITTTGNNGEITADLTGLTNVTVGLPIHSKIVSHPIDVGGKTKSVMKRIGKAQMSVHDTQAGAITINGKTGYMNPRTDHICFYGVTGMKDEIKYTITNNNGAMFHLESLLMNIEYGTLDS